MGKKRDTSKKTIRGISDEFPPFDTPNTDDVASVLQRHRVTGIINNHILTVSPAGNRLLFRLSCCKTNRSQSHVFQRERQLGRIPKSEKLITAGFLKWHTYRIIVNVSGRNTLVNFSGGFLPHVSLHLYLAPNGTPFSLRHSIHSKTVQDEYRCSNSLFDSIFGQTV